ncbi:MULTISPECIES: hypothetical protein [Salipiger]|uniref:hypothetical protein n=1 Tax=Salipiger TaxID=263377 RepID=UPI0035167DE3
MLPTYWGFTAMQMGVEMISLQMRMAQAVYEAGVMQQKAFWNARPLLVSMLPQVAAMPVQMPVSMGICGPVALAGGGRPLPRPRAGRSTASLKAVPSGEAAPKPRRHRAPSKPPEMPAAASEGGDDKTPV